MMTRRGVCGTGLRATRLVLNGTGSVGFGGILPEANSSEAQGNWVGLPGQVQLLARDGQVAPGASGGRFIGVIVPSINANARLAFVAGVVGGNSGIWVGKPDSLDLPALNGEEAPGTTGATFGSFNTPLFSADAFPLINANDQVAFLAELGVGEGGVTPEDNLGLWRGAPGDIELIARKGSAALRRRIGRPGWTPDRAERSADARCSSQVRCSTVFGTTAFQGGRLVLGFRAASPGGWSVLLAGFDRPTSPLYACFRRTPTVLLGKYAAAPLPSSRAAASIV